MQNSSPTPLVVDLDGTLTPVDTLWESVIRLVKLRPAVAWRIPFWLLHGRAVFKARISQHSSWHGQGVPLRKDLLAFLIAEKAKGRPIILATAAYSRIAETVSSEAGVFDSVLASDENTNLKGSKKLAAIVAHVGPRFTYAGDSRADLAIWRSAEFSILVGGNAGLRKTLSASGKLTHEFGMEGFGFRGWARAIRVHQWLKNTLVFVPLLTSFSILQPHLVELAIAAFIAFSCAASATYLINDLWDLDSDRTHPRKRTRALASGAISILTAIGAAALLLATATVISVFVGLRFSIALTIYVILTSAYSWLLKRFVVADVLTIACLFTLRILAGAVAIGVAVSSWLLAFSAFIFFGLALVKRCAELVSLDDAGFDSASGRNYHVGDLKVLWPMGVGASLCSVVVFGLFISSPDTAARYATPQLAWLAAVALLYWLTRLWIKTARGEMHDDPLVFAMRDRNSLATVAAIVAFMMVSYLVKISF